MKIFKGFIGWAVIASSFAFYSPSTTAAQQWIPLTIAKSGDRTYVELNSLQRRGDTAWYWVLHRFANPQPDGLAAIQFYQSANCKTKQYRVRAERQLDALDKQLAFFSDGDKGELVQARPEKIDYAVVKFACRVPSR